MVGTSQYPWKLRKHTVLRRDLLEVLQNCQNKPRLSQQLCQITHVETWHFFCAAFFLKISDVISSHQKDALLDKNSVSRWLRFVGFSHSPRISFFPSLQRQSRASPTLTACATPELFVLFHKVCFGRFVRGLGEDPPSAPLVWSSRRPLLQDQMRGHHQRPLRQGDPSH